MTDASALLAAIRAAPADDAPRLIYADWLDEHGQPERAEFIRVQCELARRDDPALRRREAELLAAHHDALAGPLAGPHLRFRFERGFIVAFEHTGVFAGRHSSATILLRFFRDKVIRSAVGRGVEDALPSIRENYRRMAQGTYELDACDFPARIQIECGSLEDRYDIQFSGAFDGQMLSPDGDCRFSGYAMLRRFVHHEPPGLDSFPET